MQRFEIPIWILNIEFKEYVQNGVIRTHTTLQSN